jgi:hypothetical protein
VALFSSCTGGDVRPERVVAGEQFHGTLIVAEQVWCLDLEVAPEVPHTVSAVQRAADDVIQR